MRYAPVAICLLALCFATVAEANHQFTLPIHARTGIGVGACTATDLPNCTTVSPRISVNPGELFRMFLFCNNIEQAQGIQGLQTAFTWPADWVLDPDGEPPVVLGCRTNQLNASEPSGPGSQFGTLATAFDCFNTGTFVAIARIEFQAGAAGCLAQLNPVQGSGRVEIVDCSNQSSFIDSNDAIGQLRLGRICVGGGGNDACRPPVAVEPATWGKIKASYHR